MGETNQLADVKQKIAVFAKKYASGKKATSLANKIEELLSEEYSRKAVEKHGPEVLELAGKLDRQNSDWKSLLVLGLVDKIALGISANSRQSVFDNALLTKNGKLNQQSRENVRLILTRDPHYRDLLRWNEFTEQAEYRQKGQFIPVTDEFANELADNIERYYRYTPSIQTVQAGIKLAAAQNAYNPVKQRIESVRWDGKPRAARFFIDYLGADNNDYVKAVTETWLVGLIARAYHPGTKFDMVPVLDGKQGIGKSALVASLCQPKYFDDSLMTMGVSKDDLIKVHSKWLIEIGELEAMSNTSIAKAKAFVTATSDNYRSPYGTVTEDHPRKTVFIGTVNQTEYLHDLTGNRRFFPIHCEIDRATKQRPRPGDFDNPEILQILAEAKVMYDQGHPLVLSPAMEAIAKQKQLEANTLDMQAALMKEYANMLVPDDWDTFAIFQRKQYWQRVREQGAYERTEKGIYKTIPKEKLHKMKSFTTSELLQVAFNQKEEDVAHGRQKGLTSKVSMVFDGDPEWKKSDHCKLFGDRHKGYKRK